MIFINDLSLGATTHVTMMMMLLIEYVAAFAAAALMCMVAIERNTP
jgi:hypothetical protein